MNTKRKLLDNAQFDAIVVLGGSISDSGMIPQFVKMRVEAAVAASHNTIPIIMSGLWSFLISYTPPRSEAAAMKAYAIAYAPGIDADTIKVEEASRDTIGTAYFSKVCFLEPRNWQQVLVITSDFHIDRTKYIYQKVLGDDYVVTLRATPSGFSADELKAKGILEDKLLSITKHFLGPVEAGDSKSVRGVMDNFPGYGKVPKYTREDLVAMLDIGIPVVDAYGIHAA